MEWTRSETIGLARAACPQCQGLGLVRGLGNIATPCSCALRAIFKACYARFRNGLMKTNGAPVVNVALDNVPRGQRRGEFGWKANEYMADFYLTSKRTLTASEWRTFSYVYLLGADWKLYQQRLRVSRPHFRNVCAHIEAKLGRAFRELQPYSLYPVDEYFSPRQRGTKVTAFPAKPAARYIPIRPPLAA